jgi:hypothetical protein
MVSDRETSPVSALFRVVIEPQSYLNLLYLLLSFPLGIFYFVSLVTGFALGVGLIITWVGIPILVGVIALSCAFAAFERSVAQAMLHAEIGPMQVGETPPGFWARLRALLTNPVTWKGIAYLMCKFPLGIVSFVVVVTLGALSLALFFAPAYYDLPGVNIGWPGGLQVDTLWEALVATAVGAVLGLISLHVFNGLAVLWKWLARALLGRMGPDKAGSVPPSSSAVGPRPPDE